MKRKKKETKTLELEERKGKLRMNQKKRNNE